MRTTQMVQDATVVLTVHDVIEEYEVSLGEKGNKPRSIVTTVGRLRGIFCDEQMFVARLTIPKLRSVYHRRCNKVEVDTHRNELEETKTFLRWCGKRGYVRQALVTRLGEVEPVGKRRKGKHQLRIDEARLWTVKALELGNKGETGAVAAMMCFLMGLRTSEVVERVVRDVDDDGQLLWVPDSKTDAGRRTQRIPSELQPFLVKLCDGKQPQDLLLGRHWRDWPCKWTRRICRLAGVPEVSAHGMRGLHATLAEEQGATAQMVVRALGHESIKTTHRHYTQPSAVANARQQRVLKVIEGGRG